MGNPNPNMKGLKSFKKGQSGNPAGRPKLPDISEAMDKILGQEKDGYTALDAILAALRVKATKGDIRAAEVLLNRGYGLPKQRIENENLGETTIRIIRDKEL